MVAIFALAVMLRALYLLVAFDGPDSLRQPDSPAFELPAQGLAEWGIIGLPKPDVPPEPFTERVPGYIVFLAALRLLFGPSPLAPVIVQIVLDGLTCVLIARLGERLRPGLGMPAGLLAALAPTMIVHSALVLSDSLFLLPFVLFLDASVRAVREPSWRAAALVGLWLGLATLVRPVTFYLIAVMPLVLAALPNPLLRRVAMAASVLVVSALVLIPWLARNDRVAGHWELASQTGVHALYWLVPLTREYGAGIPTERTVAHMDSALKAVSPDGLPADPFVASRLLSSVASRAMLESGIPVMVKAWSVGSAINLLSPAAIAAPAIQKLERPSFFATHGANPVEKILNYMKASMSGLFGWVLAGSVLLTGMVWLLQLRGLAVILRRDLWPPAAIALLALIGFYLLAVTGPITGIKYRLPLEPMLILLLAEGVLAMGARVRRRW